MIKTTTVKISEYNENGFGWSAKAYVDPQLNDQVSFDISYEHCDDEGNIEEMESVGVLMSIEGAAELARHLENAAYRARVNADKSEDKRNG